MAAQVDNIRNAVYKLPTDVKEMDRLGIQHTIWSLMIGGLFPVNVKDQVNELLSAAQERQPIVLDVGCGSGIWAFSMAKAFPHAQVVGLDLNAQEFSDAPKNFRFIHGDSDQTLPKFNGQASIVHCRCVAQHVTDPQALILLLSQALAPGGLLLLADGDWIVYDQHKKLVEPFQWWDCGTTSSSLVEPAVLEEDAHGRSWYAGWLNFLGNLTRSKNYRPIEELVQNADALTVLDSRRYLSPINWPGEGIENGEDLGKFLIINQRNFLLGSKEIASQAGFSREMIEVWGRHYEAEVDSGHFYNLWHYLTAQK
ncbi:S-adenosyl-L-methionine-dependent methyltransferase [Lentinula detonsa]|uniref:S-adenosyl-L-methionine-dependent methyltransferase n=2 Tax=Lentinula TaxID=5352 RepID=A0AA38US49_9AGAR|nr:S-adenosyl-L-methionine-dependent methyltransferase [Lentinula detonsa]